ncbi:MAG: hypothetical protein IIY55_02775 [Blautia sp.]|nr:hypothetical protein [Blautia sp.]
MKNRRILVRALAILVIIGIAVCMCIIGRGHTVYFDNKSMTGPDGTEYKAPYRIQVFVNDESVGKIKEGERAMASAMGQEFKAVLHITPEKDAKKVGSAITLKLPYHMDGIIINLPALLNGAPEEVYMEEFIPAPVTETEEDEEVVTDEFAMPTDEG